MADINTTILIIRDAIYGRQQMRFTAAGRRRALCPHMLGTTRQGAWRVLGWQFDGQAEDGVLPGWRCFDLDDIGSDIITTAGIWHRGWRVRGTQQTWIDFIYAEVDSSFAAQIRDTSPLRIRSPALSLSVPKKR